MEEPPQKGEREPENTELKAWLNCSLKTEPLAPHLIDEIALEGLDGITLQALQVRLNNRPGMSMEITEKSMNQIWNVARRLKGIEIFELPEPRSELIVYNREDYVDERGNIYEPLSAPLDLYLYYPIDQPGGTVRGSCPFYYSRRKLPGVENKSLEYVQRRYGSKLVLVASQKLREKAILGSESEGTHNMTIIQYCMLERVARARFQGEITKGNVSLNTMKIDPKSLFYQRKYLLRKKMMKKQVCSMKFGKNRTTALISVLHLPRFYTPLVPITIKNAYRMISYLSQKPLMREESAEIKKRFGKTVYTALLAKEFSDLFREVDVSLAELNFIQFEMEKRHERRDTMLRRTQKVFTFLNPPGNIESYLPHIKERETLGVEKSEINYFIKGIIYRPRLNLFDTPLHQTQVLITSGGSEGIALTEITTALHLHSLSSRASGRFAVKLKYAITNLVDKKKTKVHKYIFTGKFAVPHSIVTSVVNPRKLSQIMPTHAVAKAIIAQEAEQSTQEIYIEDDVLENMSHEQPSPVSLNDHAEYGLVLLDETSIDVPEQRPVVSKVVPKRKKSVDTTVQVVGEAEQIQSSSEDNQSKKNHYARLMLGKAWNLGPTRRKYKGSEGGYYDEKDQEALAKKNKQRVSWTAKEDHMVLLLFISSVVFIPNYNLKKLFIFNAAQIRDLLHLKSEESRSKTSLAIRRRMHFLIKNPGFKSKYTYYLQDAIRDDFVKETYKTDCEELKALSAKMFYEVPTDSILKVYDYLYEKHGGDSTNLSYNAWKGGRSKWAVTTTETEIHGEQVVAPTSEPGPVQEQTEPEGIIIEENECWAYNTQKQIMVDATKDPTTIEDLETWICRTVVFSLMFSGDSLNDVQPFLERFGEANLEFISITCRRLAICSISRRSRKFGLSWRMRRRLINHLHPIMYGLTNKFFDNVQRSYVPVHPEVTTNSASLFLLMEYLLTEKVTFQIVLDTECLKEASVDSDKAYKPFGNKEVKKLKRGETEEDAAKVNLPVLKTKLHRCKNIAINLQTNPETCCKWTTYLRSLLIRTIPYSFHDDYVEMCASDEQLTKYARLYLTIVQAKDFGISMRLLLIKFSPQPLQSGLEYLLASGYVYIVGVTERRIVSTKHINRWTMLVPSREGNFRRVLIHPWITSAGRLNWELIDRLFTAVIGVLYKHPGIQFRQIVKSLAPAISGGELAILLEALRKLDFLEICKFQRSHQPGLCTDPTTFNKIVHMNLFLELEEASFELKPFVTTKYARLQRLFYMDNISDVDLDHELSPVDSDVEIVSTRVSAPVPASTPATKRRRTTRKQPPSVGETESLPSSRSTRALRHKKQRL